MAPWRASGFSVFACFHAGACPVVRSETMDGILPIDRDDRAVSFLRIGGVLLASINANRQPIERSTACRMRGQERLDETPSTNALYSSSITSFSLLVAWLLTWPSYFLVRL